MANTTYREYPLPDVADSVSDEFFRLQQQTLVMLDLDIHGLLSAISGLAVTGHTHSITQIDGLSSALETKMNAGQTFALAGLSDVIGFLDAPDGYIPVKVGDYVVFQAAASAISNHEHSIAQVVGLSSRLATIDADVDALELAVFRAVPAGASMAFNRSTPPTGWLKENGAAVSRTTYAELFAAIGTTFGAGNGSTTFNLPDSRGEFIRGLDDGRGIDFGRALGSSQGDQNKSHTHTGTAASSGAHTHTASSGSSGAHTHTLPITNTGGSGSFAGSSADSSVVGNPSTSSAGSHTHTVTVDSGGAHTHTLSVNADGGAEARPRNVSKLICIKF